MKLALVPTRTALPTEPQGRRHRPAQGSWHGYRSCLRWEFGFTCPFCLLHEADLAEHGTEREGDITIEHHQLRSTHPEQANQYANCLLACRFCNGSRGTRPLTDEHGRTLLDPTRTAWVEHFEWESSNLKPKPGHADAEYTWFTYRLDDPKKVERRDWRCELIEGMLVLIKEATETIETLTQEAHAAEDVQCARQLLTKARDWQRHVVTAKKQLRRFQAVPRDAPERCRCDQAEALCLPSWLETQLLHIHLADSG